MTKSLWMVWVGLLCVVPAWAQFDSAAVLGTVRDASEAVVKGANVTLINQNTGAETKAVTGEDGSFTFPDSRIGTYTVTGEATGFKKAVAKDIILNVGARQRVDLKLQVGDATTIIEVTDAAAALETDSSSHGQVIGSAQIVQLPLNGRAFSDLALLAPNVHRSTHYTAGNGAPREGAFNVNGMRSTYNNFLLDGVDNNAYGTSNQGFANQVAQPSPDAVAEFKIITNNYSAEFGRAGGAVVNAATRSGTNAYHGTVYEFLRNTNLNAVGYTFGQKAANFTKPILHRNQFGVTGGGPILKDKLFFFGNYEGFREAQKTLSTASIPTLNDRARILPVTVTNPLTGKVYPANTPIPAADVSPFAQKVLSELPNPTNSGLSNNYVFLRGDRNFNDKGDGRIDYQINSSMSVFGRYSERQVNIVNEPDIPGPSGGNTNGNTLVINHALTTGVTWVMSPVSVIEFRFGWNRTRAGKFPLGLGGPSMEALYGITGLPTTPDLTGGLTSQSISGYANALGRQATNPQFQHPSVWNPKVNYTRNMGKHAIKLGYEFQTIHTEVQDFSPLYGRDTYNGNFSGSGMGDFLFGLRSQYALASYLIGNYRQHQHFLYVQDDYRVTSKLTLNLGLRWEFATPRWERDNVLTNFDPASQTLIKAKDGGLYDRALVNPDYSNWGPRLGFAYNLASKTVFRGAYGISYVHNNRVGSADLLGINGPQIVSAVIDQSVFSSPGVLNPNFRTTQQGYPTGLIDPSNFVPVRANITYVPRDLRWPYVQTWFFSVQRELARDLVLEVGYTGNHSLRLPVVGDYNQANPNLPGQTLGVQARRPLQNCGAITYFNPAGQSSYNGLSVKVEKRYSNGLAFLNSFTWSKALGNSEQQLETGSGIEVANQQNIRNLSAERGPTSYDVKFVNVTSVVYSIPFGRGQRWGRSMPYIVDAALGGWELTGINTANTGEPVNVWYTPSAANDPTGRINGFRGSSTTRPNLIGNPTGSSGADMLNNYFNKAAFQTPSSNQPFGNLGRNAFRAPNFEQWDLGVYKSFRMPREGMSLQFRSEFFNVLNHTNFQPPQANFANASFGRISSTFIPRQIQFALKLTY
jgi:hypothetical protein